jgi:3-deoxy-D-manno-octulosonate 8-phosphate phosphatase (KDO 8-P phosphatase)
MTISELFTTIRTFVFDVDGVLTDGGLLLAEDGRMLRTMDIKDGYALQLAIKKGYNIWVITGGKCEAVTQRLNRLGITEVHSSIENKREFLTDIATDTKTSFDTMLYMGDDMPDYAAMQLCGLPCCPADAVTDIKAISKYISPVSGGKGCVRDVVEKVLKLNNHWEIPK